MSFTYKTFMSVLTLNRKFSHSWSTSREFILNISISRKICTYEEKNPKFSLDPQKPSVTKSLYFQAFCIPHRIGSQELATIVRGIREMDLQMQFVFLLIDLEYL